MLVMKNARWKLAHAWGQHKLDNLNSHGLNSQYRRRVAVRTATEGGHPRMAGVTNSNSNLNLESRPLAVPSGSIILPTIR